MFEDFTSFITSLQSMFWTLIFFCAAALVIIIFLMRMLDGKYPRIRFLVMERGRVWWAWRRLDKIKIIPDDIIQLLLTRKPIGEDINAFQDVYYGNGVVYLATMVGTILHPIKFDLDATHTVDINVFDKDGSLLRTEKRVQPLLLPEEVINGARIAARYRETQIATEDLALAQQPLLVAVAVSIPIAVICGVYLLAIWLSYSASQDIVSKTATQITQMIGTQANLLNTQMAIANIQNATTNQMAGVAESMNATAQNLMRYGHG